jgi:diguanylate cyclase (GGDEF)-like protein
VPLYPKFTIGAYAGVMAHDGTKLGTGLPWLLPRWRGTFAIGALVGLAFLLAGAILMVRHSAEQRDKAAAWEVHTLEVLDVTSQLRLAAIYAARNHRLHLITREQRPYHTYRKSLAEVALGTARLNHLVSDDPRQVERLGKVERQLDYIIGFMSIVMALENAGRHDEALSVIGTGQGYRALDAVLIEIDGFENVQRQLLASRRNARQQFAVRESHYEYLLGMAALALLLVGAFATLALRRSLSREETVRRVMEKQAATDELTGLANRRETMTALDRHISATKRHERPLSIAILDIDHFKRVNDAYGHPAGDEVIRRVAQIAVEIMREEDLVGRLGGEEFVVILPDTDASAALRACDRLRAVIASTTLLLENGVRLSITLSAGVAQMLPGDDRSRLIARADEALYDAKQQGRDRVLLAA